MNTKHRTALLVLFNTCLVLQAPACWSSDDPLAQFNQINAKVGRDFKFTRTSPALIAPPAPPIDTDAPIALGPWAESVCAIAYSDTSSHHLIFHPFCSGVVTERGLLTAKSCFQELERQLRDPTQHASWEMPLVGVSCGRGRVDHDRKYQLLSARPEDLPEFMGEPGAAGVVIREDKDWRSYRLDHGLFTLPRNFPVAPLAVATSPKEEDDLLAGGNCFLAGFGGGELSAGAVRPLSPREARGAGITLDELGEVLLSSRRTTSVNVKTGDAGGPTICVDPAQPGHFVVVASHSAHVWHEDETADLNLDAKVSSLWKSNLVRLAETPMSPEQEREINDHVFRAERFLARPDVATLGLSGDDLPRFHQLVLASEGPWDADGAVIRVSRSGDRI